MMRNPSLEYCLNSVYLSYDESASNLVKKDLETATKFISEMRGKKDAVEQTVAAYQAMYSATMALLHSIGYKANGFRCVVTVLEEYFLKHGKLDKVHLDNLLRGQKLEGTPQENFDAAEAYLEAVKKSLNQ